MEPQQQPDPLGHNPYDFILNPPNPTNPHPLGGLPLPKIGNRSLGWQIFILVGGAVALMIIIAIITSALTSSNIDQTDLINLTAEQTEIARVASLGGGTVTQSANQDLAVNVQLTVESENQELLAFLSSAGIKVSAKQLSAANNAQTTLQIQNAQANSTSDVVFAQIMQTELQTYANNLKTDYLGAKNQTLKGQLNTDYAQAELLLKEVPSAGSVQS